MSHPAVSVLLVSWNAREQTRRCLDALRDASGDALPVEVVVVDNASTDGSAEMLAADPLVRLIRNRCNVGYAAAVNQAYRQAAGELILLLTGAVRIRPGALDVMAGFLRDRPDVAGVGPLLFDPDGTIRQPDLPLPGFRSVLGAGAPSLRRLPGLRATRHRLPPGDDALAGPRQLASGDCLLLRREVLAPEWVLDERFPVHGHGLMLARSLRDAGHRLWTVPQALATRDPGASGRLLGTSSGARHRVGGLVRYLRLTEPRYRLAVFRLVVLAEHLANRIGRRRTDIRPRDLVAALRGDVGALPEGDVRPWSVLSGEGQCAAEHYFRIVTGERVDDRRILLVHRPRRLRGRRLRVEFDGSSIWQATPPALLSFGWRWWPVRWVNGWFAAAEVRRWLHEQPGFRALRLDDTSRYLAGRIDEDEVVAATPPRFRPLSTGRYAPLGAADPLPDPGPAPALPTPTS
ncbi:glycosyltransferase [Plantactinospora sp. WMMB782]|uniref:glycosyltransferase n=1 Tax=Plantactinospora sp. WMMB782 TaxID=3404121 RepID=UPI003B963BD4